MQIVCTLPNVVGTINGVEFKPHGQFLVGDVPDDIAEPMLTIPGYFKLGEEPGAEQAEPPADLEPLRAEATALGIQWKTTWKAARLQAEIDAAKKAAAGN